MATKVAEAYVSIRANTATLMADLNTAKGTTVASANQMGMAFPKGIAPGVASANAQIRTIPATTAKAAAQVQAATAGMAGGFTAFAKSMAGAMGIMAGGAMFIGGAKAALDFEQSLINATAAMPDAADHMEELTMLARDWGIESGVGAAKAADAIGYLALAGYDAERAMASLPVVLKFAGAGAFDAATASDILTDALSALKLASKDAETNLANMTHVADLMSKASVTANTSVQQLGEAFLMKAGSAAANAGVAVEDLTNMLMIFADQGRKGSEAGTLAAATIEGLKKSAAKFADSNLNDVIFDSNGNMRNLSEIVEGLTREFGHLSAEERTAALMALGVNRQAMDGVNLLIGQTEAVNNYADALDNAGGATSDLAEKKWAALSQQIGVIKQQLVDFAIAVLGPFLQGVVAIVKPLANVIQAVGRWSESTNNLIPNLMKSVGIAVSLKVLLPLVATGILFVAKSLTKLMFSNPFTAILAGVIMFVNHIREAQAAGEEWAGPIVEAAKNVWARLSEIGAKIIEVGAILLDRLMPIFTMMGDVFMDVITWITGLITQFVDHMDQEVEEGRNSWDLAFEAMRNIVEGVINFVIATFNMMKAVFDTVVMAMATMWDWVFGTSFSESTEGAFQVFLDWVTSILDWLSLMTTNWGLTWELIKNTTALWILKAWNVVMNVFELMKIGALAWLGTWVGVFKGIYNWTKYYITSAFVFVKATFAGMIAMAKEAWMKVTARGSGRSLGSHFKEEFNRVMDEELPDDPEGIGDTIRNEIKSFAGGAVQEHLENKKERENEMQAIKDRNEAIKAEMAAQRTENRAEEDAIAAAQEKKKEKAKEDNEEVAEDAAEKMEEAMDKAGLLDIGFKGIQEFGRSIQDALLKDDTKKRDDKQAQNIGDIKELQAHNNEIQAAQLAEMKNNATAQNNGLAAPA